MSGRVSQALSVFPAQGAGARVRLRPAGGARVAGRVRGRVLGDADGVATAAPTAGALRRRVAQRGAVRRGRRPHGRPAAHHRALLPGRPGQPRLQRPPGQ